ncbi:hypothetical protein IGI04_006585 [Brassica rapa subsp. trilocularis]|uniref:Uncharacterized protein n=1 Tax=Brassica rapa subsp. trilocularis TaxID=1813537 RepID=A0ABQ7NHB0_BRACM|nr:hypothetical protein IGI04_006585 [Brassica rapa subsp. trilocularis]
MRSSSTPSKYGGVQKIELAKIVEFIDYVLNSAPHAVEFLCTAQVDDIETINGPMLHHQSFAYKDIFQVL